MKSTILERFAVLFIFSLAFCVPVFAMAQENGVLDPPAAEQDADDADADEAIETDEEATDEADSDADQDDSADDKKPERRAPRNDVERYSKRAQDFSDVVKPLLVSVSDSTVAIMAGRKRLALGTVVGEDGLILTKASELSGEIECQLANGDRLPVSVIGVSPETDLALLKIEATGLPVVVWSDSHVPTTGQWLITPDAEGEPVGIGVVGVDAREIPKTRAFVGIRPTTAKDEDGNSIGCLIMEVIDGTPADRAKLLQDDIIVKIDDVDIPDHETLRETLAQFEPNDLIRLTVMREDKEIRLSLNLADETNVNPDFNRSNTQNSMGSRLSARRKDFPLAFQHDSQLQASQCGGPVVDLSGRVVGLNIARGGRVFSLALPVEIILPVLEQLKTGEFAPSKVNEVKIEKIDAELKEVTRLMRTLPGRKEALEKKLKEDEGRREEIERMIGEMQDRLKELSEKYDTDSEQLRELGSRLRAAEKSQKKLEKDRKKLATGS